MLDLIVLHGEFSLFTVRGNFWYQIYQNQRQKILCQLMALITRHVNRDRPVRGGPCRPYTLCFQLYIIDYM